MTFSADNGQTWSKPVFAPWGLSGHRHHAVLTQDGRLVIASRDVAPHSPTWGGYVAWVGTFDDLRNNRPGQYRIKLLHHHLGKLVDTGRIRRFSWLTYWTLHRHLAKLGDTGYGGIVQLPDGTIVAATYTLHNEGDKFHSMVSTRFKLSETDALAGLTKKAKK